MGLLLCEFYFAKLPLAYIRLRPSSQAKMESPMVLSVYGSEPPVARDQASGRIYAIKSTVKGSLGPSSSCLAPV